MSKHSLQTEGLHSAIVIKTIVLAEVRHTHQWNRIENRKTDPPQICPSDFWQIYKNNLIKKMYPLKKGFWTSWASIGK